MSTVADSSAPAGLRLYVTDGRTCTSHALPTTGAPTGAMVEGSMLLLLAGFGLSIAGRRRYQPRHATR